MTRVQEARNQPFVSVIIPVYNDALRLRLCLEALQDQTYPAERYEVVVVDNGSGENIAGVCQQCEHVSYSHEPRPGSYAARNKGVEVARGDILAFTDADCIPSRDWLEKGVSRLMALPDCGVVGGRIEVFFKDADKPTALELHDRLFAFPQQRYIEHHKYSATANLFTFKRLFAVVGFFDPERKSGGDREWSHRVFAKDYQLAYADDVVVAHPARFSAAELMKKEFRLAGGAYHGMIETDPSLATFLREMLKLPYYAALRVKEVASNKELSMEQKAKVASVVVLKRLFRGFELVRLRLGGAERR